MSEPCAPALAHTAPPTVPGMASPNSRPERPASRVTVAALAMGRPASATRRRPSMRCPTARTRTTSPPMPASLMTRSEPRPMRKSGMSRVRA